MNIPSTTLNKASRVHGAAAEKGSRKARRWTSKEVKNQTRKTIFSKESMKTSAPR